MLQYSNRAVMESKYHSMSGAKPESQTMGNNLTSVKGADIKQERMIKKLFLFAVVLVITLFSTQSANAQKSCENKKYVSVGSTIRDRTPYSTIVQSTQASCGYKITFKSYDAEQGSIYCDVKFTNLDGEEEEWKGTGDLATIKPKAGTTISVRFFNSTLAQGVLVEYEICKTPL